MIRIIGGDNLEILRTFEKDSYDLVYLDPPFNTDKQQIKRTLQTVQSDNGHRAGFGAKKYNVTELARMQYNDEFEDYYGFLFPRLVEILRILKPTGSMLLHCDQNESHYIKVFLDSLFGRSNFRNEIVWTWDYGAKSKSYWPRKHNNIFWYSKSDNYYFDINASDRLPYMAPGLAGPDKAAKGKLPTDTWFISIVGTNSREKTNYPTQKPLKLMRRLINCHSEQGYKLLDPFAGSGSFGFAAKELNRDCDLIDSNPEAVTLMEKRINSLNYLDLK